MKDLNIHPNDLLEIKIEKLEKLIVFFNKSLKKNLRKSYEMSHQIRSKNISALSAIEPLQKLIQEDFETFNQISFESSSLLKKLSAKCLKYYKSNIYQYKDRRYLPVDCNIFNLEESHNDNMRFYPIFNEGHLTIYQKNLKENHKAILQSISTIISELIKKEYSSHKES